MRLERAWGAFDASIWRSQAGGAKRPLFTLSSIPNQNGLDNNTSVLRHHENYHLLIKSILSVDGFF